VFVKKTTRRRGDRTYTYLSLVEAARVEGRVKHNTLLRLGEITALREQSVVTRNKRCHFGSDALRSIMGFLPDRAASARGLANAQFPNNQALFDFTLSFLEKNN
jgi:hypothetical protein